MPIHTRACDDCGRRYDVLVKGDAAVSMDRKDGSLACPACGSAAYHRAPTRFAINKGGVGAMSGPTEYPYFDRGLGAVVRDAGHRKHLMEFHPDGTPRPFKLQPADGLEPAKVIEQQRTAQLKIVERYHDVMAEMTHGENRADYELAKQVGQEMYEKAKAEQAGKVLLVEAPSPPGLLEPLATPLPLDGPVADPVPLLEA